MASSIPAKRRFSANSVDSATAANQVPTLRISRLVTGTWRSSISAYTMTLSRRSAATRGGTWNWIRRPIDSALPSG